MIVGWRLTRAIHADLKGEGARRYGGRWNSPGLAVVYFADHPALAVLEVRVHLDLPPHLLPEDYSLMRVGLPDGSVEELKDLPEAPRERGDAWLLSTRSAVLIVPSVIVPGARNLLLNPLHPTAPNAQVLATDSFRFDTRLWR